MANQLNVDTGGLSAGAASSEATAAGLTSSTPGRSTSTQPSACGVAAVNAALTALQGRQSARITGQAADMSTGASAYARTDADGSDAITTVSV
ncbi:hypothetical protein H7J08_00750 [Mycobacterium frederiksbergense]|uniref:hypothetical protein n=1 Tax=Mycolicibacterium frederiksbergense TaxID=117567 RepID=UPI0021F2FD1F|nr:hypothetical protein [Mycolicibacterium frederiksbergense]MCV7043206.1 hypothetical protein [Mycolicibacterium frederiksbergense]